jgi:hypothetical protein
MLGKTLVLVCALLVASGAAAEPAPADPDDLAAGIAQVKHGDLDEAVITLDAAARRLSAAKGQGRDLARAYAYLAIAYMGLSQRVSARASFLEAWKADRSMTMSPKEFPAQAIALFEETRRQAEAEAAAEAAKAAAAKAEAEKAEAAKAEAERKRGRRGLLIGGAVAAAGAGVGVIVAVNGDAGSEGRPTLTGTWSGTVIMSGTRSGLGGTCGFNGGICPSALENVDWNIEEVGDTWSATAAHTIASYEGGSPVCSNGDILPPVGYSWSYLTRGSVQWPKILRHDALERIWGGCAEYRVQDDTITATCTLTQSFCTFSEVWRLKRQ